MQESFVINLDGLDYDVEANGNTFIVNGHPFVVALQDGGKITVNGVAYDVVIERETAIIDGIVHQLGVNGLENQNRAKRPSRLAVPASAAGAVQAIMPGTIVRLLVQEGDRVETGDVVAVLEAMKMENELTAPVSGVVQGVHVHPGEAVEMQALLVEIEPDD
jgi:biotin carboxyl carrier protein